ncbi:Protein of unknown function [Gryllus bimaculatus]|nr:Protein of unknown function [Gryllus bimaculatus]
MSLRGPQTRGSCTVAPRWK